MLTWLETAWLAADAADVGLVLHGLAAVGDHNSFFFV